MYASFLGKERLTTDGTIMSSRALYSKGIPTFTERGEIELKMKTLAVILTTVYAVVIIRGQVLFLQTFLQATLFSWLF